MFGESAEHLAKEGAEVLEEEAEQGLKKAGHLAEEEAEQGIKRAGHLAEEETEKSLRRTGDLAEEGAESGARRGSDALDEAAAGCRYTCFAEGTLVSTPNGEVPIEQIAVGDQVYSYDEETGEEHPAEVVALHHRDVTEFWLLQVGGETIETTDEHPFYVVGQGWTRAKDLREGDVLIATSGNRLPLEKVERVEQTARLYNFEVRDLHTYLVGRVGAVVHNCGSHLEQARDARGKFLPKGEGELALGASRAERVQEKLEGRFGAENVQAEQYLRNADGSIAVDSVTGEARRLDLVVIESGTPRYSVEVTSHTASKTRQAAKEARIRKAGGTYVFDRVTKTLVSLKNIATRTIRVR